MYIGICVKCPLFWQRFVKFEISLQIVGKKQITNSKEILPVGAVLFHADRRTDGQIDRHDGAI